MKYFFQAPVASCCRRGAMSVYNPAFTEEEYRARLRNVQDAMAKRDLDALLVADRADVC